jgi:hypothetical protein
VFRSCSTAPVVHQLIASFQNETEIRYSYQWLHLHQGRSNQRADPCRRMRGLGKSAATSSEALMEVVWRGTEAAEGAWRVLLKGHLTGLVWPPPQLVQLDRCSELRPIDRESSTCLTRTGTSRPCSPVGS